MEVTDKAKTTHKIVTTDGVLVSYYGSDPTVVCDEKNRRAEKLGIKARYKVEPASTD